MLVIKEKEYCFQTIKGSRFLAYGVPVGNETEVKIFLKSLQKEHPKARHFCFAWRFSDGRTRSSDDGEPKGSAGSPILKRLTSKGCVDTMIVVIRYFGGIKLGIGGLIRAYGGIAQELIENSTFTEYQNWVPLSFSYAYSDLQLVEHILSQVEHRPCEKEYASSIFHRVLVLEDDKKNLKNQLLNLSSGRITSS